jgi:hypothetical protein
MVVLDWVSSSSQIDDELKGISNKLVAYDINKLVGNVTKVCSHLTKLFEIHYKIAV